MTKANIDFESEEMQIKYRGRVTDVAISFESLKISIPKDYEYDDEIDEMLEEEEYEEESDLEERESFHLDWAEEVEESEIWHEDLYPEENITEPYIPPSRWKELHFIC